KSPINTGGYATQMTEDLFSRDEISLIENDLLGQIRQEVPANKYNTLFDGALKVTDIKEKKVIFTVTTHTLNRLLETSYSNLLQSAVERTLGMSWRAELSQ